MSRYGEPGVPYEAYPGKSGKPGEPYDPPSDPWGQGGGDLTAPQPPGVPPGYTEPPPGYAAPPPGYVEPLPGYAGPPPGYADPGPVPPGYAAPGPGEPGWEADPGQAWNADPDPAWGPDPGGPGWDEPPPSAVPPPERRSALLFVAVGVLVLVVAAAVGYALYLLSGESTPTANPTQPPAPPPTEAPATPPGTAAPGTPQNNIGLNAAMAREGDCLTNLGTDVEPQLQVVPCDSDESGPVYQVLTKVDTRVEGSDRSTQDASAQQICDGTEGYTHHYFEVSESLSFVLCMAEQADEDADE